MVQVKLKGETDTLDCVQIDGFTKFVQNANRDVFEFHFLASEYNIEDIHQLFSNESKTNEILTIGDDDQVLYKNFSLHLSTEIKNIELERETSESPAVYEQRIVVTLAQLTYTEAKLLQQEQDIAQLYFLVATGGSA